MTIINNRSKKANCMDGITFLLPAYNEEKSIGRVINCISELYPKSRLLVIDNNSTDRTAEIASKLGAEVIDEEKQGKAHAMRKGFQHIDSDYVIMLDSDNTYDPTETNHLLRPLIEDQADVVLGTRMNSKIEKGAISYFNIIGNYSLSLIASLFYSRVSDVCTGYWAFKSEVVNFLLEKGIESNGFELEVEMFIKISKNFKIAEVPITYRRRIDLPKLNSMNDGWLIFKTLCLYKMNKDKDLPSRRKTIMENLFRPFNGRIK